MTPEREFFQTYDAPAEVTAVFQRACVLMVKYPEQRDELEDIAKRLALLERWILTALAVSEMETAAEAGETIEVH